MKSLRYLSILAFSGCVFFASCNSNNDKAGAADSLQTTQDAPPMQPEPAVIEKTTLSFKDTLIDFGVKPQGEVVKLVYKFKNTGNKPLIITDVAPSCGCTVADYPKQPIAPGGEGEIVAEFDTNRSDKGTVQKLITVRANDATRNEFHLLLQGTVTEPKY